MFSARSSKPWAPIWARAAPRPMWDRRRARSFDVADLGPLPKAPDPVLDSLVEGAALQACAQRGRCLLERGALGLAPELLVPRRTQHLLGDPDLRAKAKIDVLEDGRLPSDQPP